MKRIYSRHQIFINMLLIRNFYKNVQHLLMFYLLVIFCPSIKCMFVENISINNTNPFLHKISIPHSLQSGTIIKKLNRQGSTLQLQKSNNSNFFYILNDGSLMTVSDISSLVNKSIILEVEDTNEDVSSNQFIYVFIYNNTDPFHFVKNEYKGTIAENLKLNTLIDILEDFRLVSNLNDIIIFQILSGNIKNAFSLIVSNSENNTLCLVSNYELDSETISKYQLVIQAYHPYTGRQALTSIEVTVLNENDNSPDFGKQIYHFFVSLPVKKYAQIGQVTAYDLDGDQISYRLLTASSKFIIIPQNGLVLSNTEEFSPMIFKLNLEASDHRIPFNRNFTTVYIKFNDIYQTVNSTSSSQLDIRIKRQSQAVRPTKRLEFLETAGSIEGEVVFQLEKQSDREFFKIRDISNPWIIIEPNGNVKVKKKWDYEELGREKTIDFWVEITNAGSGDTEYQRVIIQIRDVNDEPPYFINRPLPLQTVVQLNALPNTPVFTLQARDPDTDSDIHYFMVRDRTGGRFEVDERSGVVRTRGTDLFQLDMEYVIYVKAEDQNGRIDDKTFQSTPEARLSIVGGKRPPQFYMERYETEILENQKKDSDIISVKAKSFAEREIRYTLKAQGQGAGTFNIGPTSGIVKLSKELDFEDLRQPKKYNLIVTATEDSGGFSTSVELTIRVTDVNDNAPKFELPDYQAHNIEEDIPVGTSILKVKARDADSGVNAEIEYSVSDDHFSVSSIGVVSNNKRLDADNNNAYYEFQVIAKDKGDPPKTGTSTVRIYTKNKNDEEPKFSQQVYTPNVDENAGPGTLVTTVVASDKDGDNVRFGFVGAVNHAGQFEIEENTGVIRLQKGPINLDRDKYELNVTAMDDGSCCENGASTLHTSTAVVVVFITDVNDNKPIFEECASYSPKVEEGAPNGSPVVRVMATDKDKGMNGQVKYSIVQQPNQKGTKFTVDADTGELFTNKVFDREGDDGKFVSVTVKATDQGEPSLEGVCSFTIEITDVNDNPPLFDRQDTHIGANILRVSASDEDADSNGAIFYHLHASSNPADLHYFDIQSESGWITLKKPLDKESFQLHVRAEDHGEPKQWAEVDVELIIVDRNNKPPIWESSIFGPIYVPENQLVGSTVTSVYARESYRLEAVAQDKGVPFLTRSVEVQINVVDRANKPPQWDQLVYGPIYIRENQAVGSRILSVKARSGIEDNPTVFYKLIRGSTPQTNKFDTFYVQQRINKNHTWADIRVNHPLDYETIREYNLTIRVENNGAQQLASEATIHIVLEDVNDEIPLFTEREQETVLEGEPIGTKVTQVCAIDKDGTFPNNQVYYSIVDSLRNEGKDFFEINEQTGVVYTKIIFDREQKQAYALEIEARDGASSARPNSDGRPNAVTKFIRIGIADKNDNPPYFDKTLYEAEVDENEDIQHTVLTVTAKDNDESSRIRYEITKGNFGGAFAVKNMTGAIYVAGPLDYETRKRYELRLVASDNLNENFTTVVIHVKDVNDNPPVFDRPVYETQITEEDDRNLPKRILQYELTLVASDSLNENETRVIININDVNDLPPVFDENIYHTELQEELSSAVPANLLKVTATDGDRDRPQNIVYFLTGQGIDSLNPDNSKFDVNRTSGEIYVLKPLDRDEPNGRPQWRFTVFAQDEGGEGLVGYADVQVNLKDINDNAPFFPHGIYFGNVTENGTEQMVVMTMTAVDYDDPSEGTNAKLSYSIDKNVIDENTGRPIFEIEPYSGVIKTAVCCLDREKTPDYTIQVVAMDGGGLKGTGTASIHVKDINDMPPQFSKDHWTTIVDETDTSVPNLPDSPILTVTVLDEDETNKFHYKVLESSGFGADKFTMVRNSDGTGSLKIVQPLDYEDPMQRRGFKFKIQVNDKGEDNDNDRYHVAYSWVSVELRDINDNRPIFDRTNIDVSVFENAEIGKSLETFCATDPDNGGNSLVSFAIDRNSDRRRQFSISQTGVVKIQRSLDREETPRHQIKILAIDDGKPSKTATATLTVNVQDINDNAPHFMHDYHPVIPENSPPRKVVEILAMDDDDRSKSNGPPFTFRLDPTADDEIKSAFRVEHDPRGANGDGMAIVHSLKSFDREQQKYYLVPIIIKDSGNPAMSGTSTLTVVIGDENDNRMHPGSKEILVFCFKGYTPDTEIGRVYVHDQDDWDLPDKKFYWRDQESHHFFILNEDSGMLTVKQNTPPGRYFLQFYVYDRKHTQSNVVANVTVRLQEITEEAVRNSGSFRIYGTFEEDFIRIWNYKDQQIVKSKLEKFCEKFALLIGLLPKDIDVFSVQMKQEHIPITDIRFSAHGSPYRKPVYLNGIVLSHREELESELDINITMVGIDECLYENVHCEGSCTNYLIIDSLPYLVNANRTALVGVRTEVIPECTCGARNFSKPESCQPNPCLNNGRCIEERYRIKCICRKGFDGPRCQKTTRSFQGNGWAWFSPLSICETSHLSLEFITIKPDGLLFYNGPIVAPKLKEHVISDFISLELENEQPRLLIDFGSGTLELQVSTQLSLSDGEWHRIDILWDSEQVSLIVDSCHSSDITELEDGSEPHFDNTSCYATGMIPPFSEYLNLNTPLQLGGISGNILNQDIFSWSSVPYGHPFEGCIRNFIYNSELYDMSDAGQWKNSEPGCRQTEEMCINNAVESSSGCGQHGMCSASLSYARCECHPGWSGLACDVPTIPTAFDQQSYVKYALSFEPHRFLTEIQLSFRTREQRGELFRISDQHNREYGIVELQDGHLRFRYNLNSLRTEERILWLTAVVVNDGQWHVVKAKRFGSAAIMQLDGGEGRHYNETFIFEGHQLMAVDKQEGVYAGGKAEYTGVRTFEVFGCLDDIRLEERHLPLPPGLNGTPWGQATMYRNLKRDCHSNNPCSNVICHHPFVCVDLWMEYECACMEGHVLNPDSNTCLDLNECLLDPCHNGGTCINHDPGFNCICPSGYYGITCSALREGHVLRFSTGFLAAILVCLLFILDECIKEPCLHGGTCQNLPDGRGYVCHCSYNLTGQDCHLEASGSTHLGVTNEFIVALIVCILTLMLLVLVLVVYNRKRISHLKCPGPDDDIRENIINYDDEGGGEDDMTAFDITPLQIPIDSLGKPLHYYLDPHQPPAYHAIPTTDTVLLVNSHKAKADLDPSVPPFDDLRNYAYEGGGSSAGSLSSLASGSEDNEQDFEYLDNWGPRFAKLATMYGQGESDEEES